MTQNSEYSTIAAIETRHQRRISRGGSDVVHPLARRFATHQTTSNPIWFTRELRSVRFVAFSTDLDRDFVGRLHSTVLTLFEIVTCSLVCFLSW